MKYTNVWIESINWKYVCKNLELIFLGRFECFLFSYLGMVNVMCCNRFDLKYNVPPNFIFCIIIESFTKYFRSLFLYIWWYSLEHLFSLFLVKYDKAKNQSKRTCKRFYVEDLEKRGKFFIQKKDAILNPI